MEGLIRHHPPTGIDRRSPPVYLRYASHQEKAISHCRRILTHDGRVMMGLKPFRAHTHLGSANGHPGYVPPRRAIKVGEYAEDPCGWTPN